MTYPVPHFPMSSCRGLLICCIPFPINPCLVVEVLAVGADGVLTRLVVEVLAVGADGVAVLYGGEG